MRVADLRYSAMRYSRVHMFILNVFLLSATTIFFDIGFALRSVLLHVISTEVPTARSGEIFPE